MPAVNKTSRALKKPGQYNPRSKSGQTVREVKRAKKARMYSKLRAWHTGEQATEQQQQQPKRKREEEEEEEEAEAEEEEEEQEHDEAEEDAACLDDDADDASASAGDSSSVIHGVDGFSVSFAPFVSSDSASIASTAPSSLKDDRILGAALYEWLLLHQKLDCHGLWEKFQVEWDLITETERPPGTNRPINLHAYLTGLRNPTNKHTVRRDIRLVRDTLERERARELQENPLDPLAPLQLAALNGSLLSYYLKVKNLIPYESQSQRRKREGEERRKRRMEEEQQKQQEEEEDEVVEQPKKKHKGARAAPAGAAAPPAEAKPEALVLGQTNSWALLLDCD